MIISKPSISSPLLSFACLPACLPAFPFPHSTFHISRYYSDLNFYFRYHPIVRWKGTLGDEKRKKKKKHFFLFFLPPYISTDQATTHSAYIPNHHRHTT